jgi:hypothetical protein
MNSMTQAQSLMALSNIDDSLYMRDTRNEANISSIEKLSNEDNDELWTFADGSKMIYISETIELQLV